MPLLALVFGKMLECAAELLVGFDVRKYARIDLNSKLLLRFMPGDNSLMLLQVELGISARFYPANSFERIACFVGHQPGLCRRSAVVRPSEMVEVCCQA
jgi:hypothetical protein